MRVFRVLWPLISLPMMLSFCYIYNATRSFGSTMWRSAAKSVSYTHLRAHETS